MTARHRDHARTNRDGQRPDVASIPRGRPTLPPLPSLAEPLYVIGAAARTPKPAREEELSDPICRRPKKVPKTQDPIKRLMRQSETPKAGPAWQSGIRSLDGAATEKPPVMSRGPIQQLDDYNELRTIRGIARPRRPAAILPASLPEVISELAADPREIAKLRRNARSIC
jgi:hypothetical protein